MEIQNNPIFDGGDLEAPWSGIEDGDVSGYGGIDGPADVNTPGDASGYGDVSRPRDISGSGSHADTGLIEGLEAARVNLEVQIGANEEAGTPEQNGGNNSEQNDVNGGEHSGANEGEHPRSPTWTPALQATVRMPSFLRKRVAAVNDDDWMHDRDLEHAMHHHRSKSTSSWMVFLGLAYKSVGIVYGDLGTSPMYLWQTCFSFPATEDDIVGALSLVLWTLSLMVFKYSVIVLPANDMGEGGTFAIYSLICRNAKVTIFGLKHESDKGLACLHLDHKKKRGRDYLGRRVTKAIEKSKFLQKLLLVFVLLGTCALVGDGVLTPAVTVLSAMTGLQVPQELLNSDGTTKLSNGVVIAATCIIMFGIFNAQRFGTSKIGVVFAPILITFFLLNAGIGVFNISKWNPGIFKAISPHYGILYLVRNGRKGWISLGGICLCITGVEGLFADLGHFSVNTIRASTMGLVYPSLLLIYFGQGAYLSKNPGDVTQAYFKAIPHAIYWPTFVVATLAAMVASQAIISGTFSVLSQSMSLQCFPPMMVVHTSKMVRGQIYIPKVNWALMTLGIACVLGFSLPQPSNKPINGDALGNAFGIAVMFVMVVTTCLVTLVMLIIWRTRVELVALFFSFFMFFEIIYLTANLYKIEHGGFVPIGIALVVAIISYAWHWGSTNRYLAGCRMGSQLEDVLVPEAGESYVVPENADEALRNKLLGLASNKPEEATGSPTTPAADHPFHHDDHPGAYQPLHLCLKTTGQRVAVTKGAALFYCDTIYRLPPHFAFSLKAMPAVHEVMIFLTMREIPVPHVADSERLLVKPLAYPGFYRVVARYGYMDEANHSLSFAKEILRAISHYLAYGSTKELLSRPAEDSAPASPMSHVSSSSALSHVGSSTALVAGHGETPRSPSEFASPLHKKPMRLSLTERGLQLSTLKLAQQHEIMYITTKPVLHPVAGSTRIRRFLLWLYNALESVSRDPIDSLDMPISQLLELLMVYEI